MAEPVDLTVPMLREMRARMDKSFDEVKAMIAALDRRMGAKESRQDSFRSALSADSLLSKLVAGEFEERIGALERKVRELEHLK
jgi:hypothetical protein